jgi:UDP-N-acetylmuramoyl-tripeptide--D-alanyl-D-alanine ligase
LDVATVLPINGAVFSIAELLLVLRGVTVASGPLDASRGAEVTVGVCTDSRRLAPGQLFVALNGEKFDGHEHVAAAAASGAQVVVVEKEVSAPPGCLVLRVPNTLTALAQLARLHRERWSRNQPSRQLIGITGSAGKTTTRHAVGHLLRALGHNTHTSLGNLNNAIGAPMSLLGLEPGHELGVIEMGMNSPGEIAHLAATARPTIGLVTLVAHAHTEGVGDVWGVLREKSSLLAALGPEGVAIVNGDDPLTRACLAVSPARRSLVYGVASDAAVRLVERKVLSLELNQLVMQVDRRVLRANVQLLGHAGALACLAAVATALAVDRDVSAEQLETALQAIPPNEAGRLDVSALPDGTVLINDAYNANPASMISSINVARELADALGRPLVLALGTMFELGCESDALHHAVGVAAHSAKPKAALIVGAGARALFEGCALGLEATNYVAEPLEAEASFLEMVAPGDVVLVKASNSLGLGRLAQRLKEARS